MYTEQELKKAVAKAQLELVQGYYNKIFHNKPSLEKLLDMLTDDRLHLQQEFAIIEVEEILNK